MADDRKDKVERVLSRAVEISRDDKEAARAWNRLCVELEDMIHPESPMPRFNGLLQSVLSAAILTGNPDVKSKYTPTKPEYQQTKR